MPPGRAVLADVPRRGRRRGEDQGRAREVRSGAPGRRLRATDVEGHQRAVLPDVASRAVRSQGASQRAVEARRRGRHHGVLERARRDDDGLRRVQSREGRGLAGVRAPADGSGGVSASAFYTNVLFFTHRPVSTFDRVFFQLTDELLYFVWNDPQVNESALLAKLEAMGVRVMEFDKVQGQDPPAAGAAAATA